MVYAGTALVTGCCGFSAYYLIKELLKNNWRVFCTDKRISKEFTYEFLSKTWFYLSDLTDKESLINLRDNIYNLNGFPLIIFHTASVFDYSASKELLEAVNVEGTRNLLDVFSNYNVKKFVLWSSLAVYGKVNKKNYELPVTENQTLCKKAGGLYDKSKRNQEALVVHNHYIPSLILRPAPIYGARSKYGFYILMKYIRQGSIPMIPRNLAKRNMPMIHAKDLARVALYLVNRGEKGVFNICDDNTLNFLETVRFVSFLTDADIKVYPPFYMNILKPFIKIFGKISAWFGKLRKRRAKLETDSMMYMFGNFYFSNEKLKSTGFKFKYGDRRIGLIKTIDWYNKWGWK